MGLLSFTLLSFTVFLLSYTACLLSFTAFLLSFTHTAQVCVIDEAEIDRSNILACTMQATFKYYKIQNILYNTEQYINTEDNIKYSKFFARLGLSRADTRSYILPCAMQATHARACAHTLTDACARAHRHM
jgi:hypothetical protein